MATSVTANTTTKTGFSLGSSIFRPNATVSANVYRLIIGGELLLLLFGWLMAPTIIPGPLAVLATLKDMVLSQGLIGDFYVSVVLNLQAITISTLVGLMLSYLATLPVLRPIATIVGKGRFVSLVGLSFLLTLWVGGGHALKLWELVIGMTVFFTTSMVDVVLQVPKEDLDYVRTLRAGEWEVMYQMQVRSTLGQAFDVLRQNAAMGWLMLAMVEGTVRSEGGIGTMLADSNKHFSLSAIFAIQSIFVLVGVGQDLLIAWLKTVCAPWAVLEYSKETK